MRGAFSTFCCVFLNITALISFYITFKSLKTAIIYTMPIIIISLIVVIVKLTFQIKRIESEKNNFETKLKEEENKNKALAKQFTKKKHKLENIESYWSCLNSVFLNTIQGSKNERFKEAYELYCKFSILLNNEEE